MKGLSFVEIVLALAILSVICGISFFIFHQSATSSYEIEGSSTLIQQLSQGVGMIRWDMLSTKYSLVDTLEFNDSNFPDSGDLCAWVFPIAYHKDSNEFKVDGDFNPDWQGGIVYCPYRKDMDSPPELRRYSFYDGGNQPFEINSITVDQIIVHDKDSTEIAINRHWGSAIKETVDISGAPKYRVAVSKILKTEVNMAPDSELSPPLLKVILLARVKGRFENKLFEDATLYVSPRN